MSYSKFVTEEALTLSARRNRWQILNNIIVIDKTYNYNCISKFMVPELFALNTYICCLFYFYKSAVV